MSRNPRIPPRFKVGDKVVIRSSFRKRFFGKQGLVIRLLESRHSHTLDKYTVRFDADETEVFWDFDLKKLESEGD